MRWRRLLQRVRPQGGRTPDQPPRLLRADGSLIRHPVSGIDPLTGLLNRQALMEALQAQSRAGTTGAVLLMDLDDFKVVNDTLGHMAGDRVLRLVADRLLTACPEGSSVHRLGGDEFAVLLTGCTLDEGRQVALRALAGLSTPLSDGDDLPGDGDEPLPVVTATIGVARTPRRHVDHALARADRCMYQGKVHRRGIVVTEDELEDVLPSRRDLTQKFQQVREQRDAMAELAYTDELTRVGNRRAFDMALQALHLSAEAHELPYAVVYLDLDKFHDLNRARGDDAGDEALRVAAFALVSACRRHRDTVYRKGGEELVALLEDADVATGLEVAERMRLAVRAAAIPYEDRAGSAVVTISGGLAVYDPSTPVPAERVVAAANRAMIKAKASGRDRVVVATEQ